MRLVARMRRPAPAVWLSGWWWSAGCSECGRAARGRVPRGVHELEHWLWTDLPHDLGSKAPPWYLVIGLPVVGAAVCVVAQSLLPGDGGGSPLKGIAGGGPSTAQVRARIALALGTLSFGAVARVRVR